MGDYLLYGVGGTVLLAVLWFASRSAPTGCPTCEHNSAVDSDRCGAVDDYSGWVSNVCNCQNDYHWNQASVRA